MHKNKDAINRDLKVFDALKLASKNWSREKEFPINPIDATDLSKLKPADLMNRGYEEAVAENVSYDLLHGSLIELGKTLGIKFTINSETHLFARND
jgi:hypothetical protein